MESGTKVVIDSVLIPFSQMANTTDVVPKTAANFRAIAEGSTTDVKQTYKGSIFHRIIPGVGVLPSVLLVTGN
jgi:hypothetical protein